MGFFWPPGRRPNPVRLPAGLLVWQVLGSWEANRDPALARGQLGNLGDGADFPSHVSGEHSRDLPLEQALASV